MSLAPTAFARAVRAMQLALQAAPPVSTSVLLARSRVLPRQTDTAVVLRPLQARRDASVGERAPAVWLTSIGMDCYARGANGADAYELLDQLLGASVGRLMQDPSLGGLVGAIEPQGIEWEFDVDGEQTACAAVSFQVLHATAAARLS